MRICLKENETVELALQDCLWDSEPVCPTTSAFLTRMPDAFRIRFLVVEANPRAKYREMNDPVYTDSCVEWFVQPMGQTGTPYVNFEMNAHGTLLLGYGTERNHRVRLGPDDVKGIVIETDKGTMPEGDPYWELTLMVPFNWLEKQFPGFSAVAGTLLKMNIYKCGDKTPVPHYGSWNPMTSPEPDFHRPEDFGEVLLC